MIIGNIDTLTSLLPNVMKPVKGESSIYEKLTPFMESAEQWVKDNLTSEDVFTEIAGMADGTLTKTKVQHVVAYEAYINAIPSLDLILTPNGFGIVSSQNVVPASKERVERLISSLIDNRDIAIDSLLHLLIGLPSWKTTSQCKFFASVLFPDLKLTRIMPAADGYKSNWDWYLELRSQLITIEEQIAENFVSPELMAALRQENQEGVISDFRKYCVEMVQSVEVRCLKSEDPLAHLKKEIAPLRILVNSIMNSPEDVPEWFSSDTAKLFDPPIYENRQEDTGYWF